MQINGALAVLGEQHIERQYTIIEINAGNFLYVVWSVINKQY